MNSFFPVILKSKDDIFYELHTVDIFDISMPSGSDKIPKLAAVENKSTVERSLES